jgi:hypothetical protein
MRVCVCGYPNGVHNVAVVVGLIGDLLLDELLDDVLHGDDALHRHSVGRVHHKRHMTCTAHRTHRTTHTAHAAHDTSGELMRGDGSRGRTLAALEEIEHGVEGHVRAHGGQPVQVQVLDQHRVLKSAPLGSTFAPDTTPR